MESHFADIGQDPHTYDVTFENCQARVRTLELMDYANKNGGFVIGTGDLSELALGWATYNGDHMSMYGVNAGVPKTLVRHIVQYVADTCGQPVLRDVLVDILDTPVSPELLPSAADGTIAQQFKRSCLPDGPKVGSVTLSPRADWRMPSDACNALWLKELDEIEAK